MISVWKEERDAIVEQLRYRTSADSINHSNLMIRLCELNAMIQSRCEPLQPMRLDELHDQLRGIMNKDKHALDKPVFFDFAHAVPKEASQFYHGVDNDVSLIPSFEASPMSLKAFVESLRKLRQQVSPESKVWVANVKEQTGTGVIDAIVASDAIWLMTHQNFWAEPRDPDDERGDR